MLCQKIDIKKIVFKLGDEKELSDDFRMDELVRSVQQHGLFNPILVRTRRDSGYDLLAGKRKMLGWEKIPVIIRDDLKKEEALTISLIENLQRADPAPLIIARNLKKIYENL